MYAGGSEVSSALVVGVGGGDGNWRRRRAAALGFGGWSTSDAADCV